MIFGEVGLDDAVGAVVAHTHRLGDRVIRKGAVLDAEAVRALAASGRDSVIAARLEPGDVDEDASAARVAEALLAVAAGLRAGPAATGRVNLHAERAGLLRVSATHIDALNRVGEGVTIATLPDLAVVAPRDMVATIKIIPFAVAESMLREVEALAATGAPFALHPFRPLLAGLVLSELPGLKPSVIEGTIAAMTARVAQLGGRMLPPRRCAHDAGSIAAGLRQLALDGAELLLVAGASATVDRRDVGPAAIVAAGGEVLHFGMPVDPGNLICVGSVGGLPALVLPGCARSPKANGIDWVMQRLFAGFPVSPREIMGMGVGGLLKEAPRPWPRVPATPTAPGQVAAIVLAAGLSSRMAPHHKLLAADAEGTPMLARVVDQALASRARPVLVVLGHRATEVRAALAGRPVRFVTAPDYQAGLSASLRAGLTALPAEVAAALVCLGDMPLVTGEMLDRLIAAWNPEAGRVIVQAAHRGQMGNPVLWDRRFFAEMCSLTGDSGARSMLRRHADVVTAQEVGGDAVLRDFDTPESLRRVGAWRTFGSDLQE